MALLTKSGRNSKKSQTPAEHELEEIQKLAYQFFVERGCDHGYDQEDWLKAERIVRNKS